MGARDRQSQWKWIVSIWLGLGLFAATQTVLVMRAEGMHHAWAKLFLATLLAFLPWMFATIVALRLGEQFPPVGWRPFSTWFVHIAACSAIGLLFAAWNTWLDMMLDPYANASARPPFAQVWLDKFCNGILWSAVLYGAILTIGYVLESRERLAFQQTESARLNEQLAEARLSALRRQIEPHFLFNSLNAVTGLVREGKSEAAVNMIAGLSDFLRRVLEDGNRQHVPLREEMEFVQRYIDIQKVRFADRLRVSVEVNAELLAAQVPSLILQPMVENAVKHGIAKRAPGGAIRITASRRNGMLTLSVRNDGPSLPVDWETSRSGIGIANVRTRLESLYGDAFQLSMRNQEAGGVEVSLSLPFVEEK